MNNVGRGCREKVQRESNVCYQATKGLGDGPGRHESVRIYAFERETRFEIAHAAPGRCGALRGEQKTNVYFNQVSQSRHRS